MNDNRVVPTEIYDRCVGYFRPTFTMNKGKQDEQKERKRFDPKKISNSLKELTKSK